MKITPSAHKHGYTEEEVNELLTSFHTLEIEMDQGPAGLRYKVVGLVSTRDHPIEVGVEYPSDGSEELVFHADKARNPYLRAYEESKK
jgi:hypothetical protein